MASKAAKRARKRKITLPGGGQVEQKPSGRDRTNTNQREDAQSAVLQAAKARLRLLGMTDSPEAQRAALAPENGCSVGRAIQTNIKAPDERADLHAAVKHIRRVWVAYDRAIGAPSRHAQCLRILAPPDILTSEGARVDDRPEADRYRSAVSAWTTLQGWMMHTDGAARQAAIMCVVDEPETGVTNWPGVLRVLLCVNEGIKGQRVKVR